MRARAASSDGAGSHVRARADSNEAGARRNSGSVPRSRVAAISFLEPFDRLRTLTTATRVRYRVLTMAVLLAAVTYLDRVCISITAPDMMRDLSLTPVQMSFVFSAFTLA